ncbi:TonB-dependent receptor [Abyssalbus ytuae]|uniref:TonB-dependent receptor n=1 Tax=Abyssalbus ytuae TaxID=2926907 RepID=A0A9E6ZW09_9FLAO|nr:TonB-dependent receptor [Abyssalbus ytuae]UOB16252.1 TonB-dependent receptor [Abyssalbus ytuae]
MKNLFAFFSLLALSVGAVYSQEEQTKDSVENKTVKLDEVLVSAVRVTSQSPVTFSNIQKEDLKSRNLGQDIPILMNFLPSVVTTSDAGAGVGYTGIRVRGSDATRVNVTINGIPYNDAESHGTYWVDLPDFSSSTESLQLQRGIGTSTNGSAAFGASLNLLTDAVSEKAYGEITNSAGSFNTHKHSIKFSTGKLNDHVEISGRLSAIKSDGYIDRAFSDLKSYFLQGTYIDDNTLIKALTFGGHEITYQAWNGIDEATLNTNRTFNFAGAIYDEEGNIVDFYDDETDNYKQDHAQLHWNEQLSDNWGTNLALHYTYGRGFYEQYKQDDDFETYGFEPITVNGEEINTTDLIRRRWLDNDFYGTTFSVNYKNNNFNFIAGGAWNRYEGQHFGEIIWARYATDSNIRDRYYDNDSEKTDFNVYSKANYDVSEELSLFADLQYRSINYQANGPETGLVDDTFDFFNPKVGLTYEFSNNNSLYFSYARAGREPNRTDYENGEPKAEKLNDFELGWRYLSQKTRLNFNVYYMQYKDQLVKTGELNDVGGEIRRNVDDSYRLGLEIDSKITLTDQLSIMPNLALSINKIKDFTIVNESGEQNLGDTNISFSPNVIFGNIISFNPLDNLNISLLSKFVGEQYAGNLDTDITKLDSYFVNDINAGYEIKFNKAIKSISINALVNNVFDEKYVSNAYLYGEEYLYYYPQAGINFLVGATIRF